MLGRRFQPFHRVFMLELQPLCLFHKPLLSHGWGWSSKARLSYQNLHNRERYVNSWILFGGGPTLFASHIYVCSTILTINRAGDFLVLDDPGSTILRSVLLLRMFALGYEPVLKLPMWFWYLVMPHCGGFGCSFFALSVSGQRLGHQLRPIIACKFDRGDIEIECLIIEP